LRGDLSKWFMAIQEVELSLRETAGRVYTEPWKQEHANKLGRVVTEISQAQGDLSTIAEDLAAAKADAEYREVLVRAWPTNHFLDRMSYIGGAILGAGGAGYVLAGWEVAAVFWAVGLVLMGWALAGLRNWERKRWDFYADQFSVEAKYRP